MDEISTPLVAGLLAVSIDSLLHDVETTFWVQRNVF